MAKAAAVPESLLKKRKRADAWAATRQAEAAAKQKKNAAKKDQIFKRAEQYVKEYVDHEKDLIRLKREARANGGYHVPAEARLMFVVRIRGVCDMHPKTRKILQLLRLRQINNGIFLKVNKATLNMLKKVEPYVTFGYPTSGSLTSEGSGPPVLDGFDLIVEPGETVAIVGRTGCGKSTVARLLPRFYDVTSGAVLVDGIDVRDRTLSGLRDAVSQVPDESFLFSESLHDNVAFGRPCARRSEVEKASRVAQADGFIGELTDGYDEVVGERGYTLSGGQRQRVALARTVLTDPRVLILDDATSAIDVQTEEAIHRGLVHLMSNRTTIVIAHRLSTINLADRVVLMEGGKVVADGTHAHLLATEPRYTAILTHGDAETVGVP